KNYKQFQLADFNLTLDSPKFYLDKLLGSDTNEVDYGVLFAPFPQKIAKYNLSQETRKYDVAFCGQIGSYRSYRRNAIDKLINSNFNFFYSCAEQGFQITYDDMMQAYANSKIVINFSQSTVQDHFQLKGRVFEAIASGALLLEQAGSPIDLCFVVGVHYDVFHSNDELIEKIQYYLDHPSERIKMANAAHLEWINNFSGTHFWKRLIKLPYGTSNLTIGEHVE
ncbi:MAG: glycosyltransferase, partial [Gammaproteobacteria bacterium]|nr:glycosyltransferase [Gammaproteobacteria bacterium]